MSSTTRFVVEDLPMYDVNLGKLGGVVLVYTGDARRHPWPSRKGEFIMDGTGVAKLVSGDTYRGEFTMGLFHGNGNMQYANGDVFEGQWQNNLRHGYGVLDTTDGTSYIGTFKFGDKDGAGEEIFADGTTFVGIFRGGKRNGVGRIRVKSTGDMVDGNFVNGQLEGLVTVTYGHGDVFVGRFESGEPHGEGKYTQVESGDVYLEQFFHGHCVEGVLDPNEDPVGDLMKYSEPLVLYERRAAPPPQKKVCTVQYHGTNDRYVGEWKRSASGSNRRGVRHGHGKLEYANSQQTYIGAFEDDLREGYGVLWFPLTDDQRADRSLRLPVCYRGQFHRDLMDGEGCMEFTDGSFTRQFFSKGEPHGICIAYYPEMNFSQPAGVQFLPSVRTTLYIHGSPRSFPPTGLSEVEGEEESTVPDEVHGVSTESTAYLGTS